MPRPMLFSLTMTTLFACGPEVENPDRSYLITVKGESDTCTGEEAVYEDTFTYDVFIDGSTALIQIDTEDFAVGSIFGCSLTYQSTVWFEEASGGSFQWQISGEAQFEDVAQGCDLPEDTDWEGTERLVVVDSDNPDVLSGCDYDMTLTGVLLGG